MKPPSSPMSSHISRHRSWGVCTMTANLGHEKVSIQELTWRQFCWWTFTAHMVGPFRYNNSVTALVVWNLHFMFLAFVLHLWLPCNMIVFQSIVYTYKPSSAQVSIGGRPWQKVDQSVVSESSILLVSLFCLCLHMCIPVACNQFTNLGFTNCWMAKLIT